RLQAAVAMLGLLVVGYLVMERADFLGERFHQAFERENSPEQNVRPLIWKAGMTMWQDHKLMGAGPGQFDALFPLYRPAAVQERPGWMHNDYLQLLVEYGTIGASLLALGMLLLLAGAWKTRKYVLRQGRDLGNQRHSNRAAFVMGASISLVAIAVHSLLDFNLYIPANGLLAVALAGMLVSHLRFTTESHWWRCFWPNRVFAALLCLGLLMVVKEKSSEKFEENSSGFKISGVWKSLKQNRVFIRLLMAWFFNGLANGIPAALFFLFLEFRLGATETEKAVLILVYFVSAVLFIPVWRKLSDQYGKHRMWSWAMLIASGVFILVPLIPDGALVLFGIICVITGAALGADLILPPS
ncbi:MAG: MFS transporter, partial [Alphaproteobacteria bacterium]